jgi:hypothetical protein
MPVYTSGVASALAAVVCFEAHVDFQARPREDITLQFAYADESGKQLNFRRGVVFTPAADPDDVAGAVYQPLIENDWKASWVKGAPVVIVRGSDKAPITRVNFRSTTGWTPKVTMVPVLRAPVPKADDKK